MLCLTGFILFLVEAKRSDGVQGSNYVIGFPLKDESHVQNHGMHFPAATICPAVSLGVAGSTGLGQITNLQCAAAGYAPLPVPPVSVQSVIVKKTDFTTDQLANYACWTVNADMKFLALSSSHTIKCDAFFANLDGLPEAEAAVTYFDPRSESLDRAPSVDQFLWHSLHSTALTSMYIEPKELVFLNGRKDWCAADRAAHDAARVRVAPRTPRASAIRLTRSAPRAPAPAPCRASARSVAPQAARASLRAALQVQPDGREALRRPQAGHLAELRVPLPDVQADP